jgi:hypothetical protein
MSIKELFALLLIIAGIGLNLMLQDSMAEGAATDWQAQQLQDRPANAAVDMGAPAPADSPGGCSSRLRS